MCGSKLKTTLKQNTCFYNINKTNNNNKRVLHTENKLYNNIQSFFFYEMQENTSECNLDILMLLR